MVLNVGIELFHQSPDKTFLRHHLGQCSIKVLVSTVTPAEPHLPNVSDLAAKEQMTSNPTTTVMSNGAPLLTLPTSHQLVRRLTKVKDFLPSPFALLRRGPKSGLVSCRCQYPPLSAACIFVPSSTSWYPSTNVLHCEQPAQCSTDFVVC